MPTHRRRTASARLRRLAALVVASTLGWAGPAAGQAAPDAFAPAAFVDGRAVTNFDVDQRARLLELVGVTPERDPDEALESMIEERLKEAAVAAAGVEMPREAVNEGLGRFAATLGVEGPAGLERRLRAAGMSLAQVRDYVETEVRWSALVRRDFLTAVEVTEAELDAEIAAAGIDRRVVLDLGEISVPEAGDPAAARARAADAAADIRGGAAFSDVARRVSRAPSARNGGRLGDIPLERLPPRLAGLLVDLAPGEITDPLEVPGGWVILGVFGREETPVEITPEQREQLRLRLVDRRLARRAEGRLQELRADAYVERR